MTDAPVVSNFIVEAIEEDLRTGRYNRVARVSHPSRTATCILVMPRQSASILVWRKFGGKCNLRYDDTNPIKEDVEFVDAIKEDIRWLGFDWEDREFYASDYFEQLYDWAVELIKKGKAYVDDLSPEEIREYRGTLTEPGKDSPYRSRSVEENLDLFERMRAGEFPEGSRVLRAKIDMASAI
jgi:glutaminyl-tRNA synthetase